VGLCLTLRPTFTIKVRSDFFSNSLSQPPFVFLFRLFTIEFQIPDYDNLYLDMNGIIHPCSHPNDDDPHFRKTEEDIFADICHYIEVSVHIVVCIVKFCCFFVAGKVANVSTVASKGHILFYLFFFHLRLSCYFLAT